MRNTWKTIQRMLLSVIVAAVLLCGWASAVTMTVRYSTDAYKISTYKVGKVYKVKSTKKARVGKGTKVKGHYLTVAGKKGFYITSGKYKDLWVSAFSLESSKSGYIKIKKTTNIRKYPTSKSTFTYKNKTYANAIVGKASKGNTYKAYGAYNNWVKISSGWVYRENTKAA